MPITFDEIAAIDNGAHFYTADLHVHSYGGSDEVADTSFTPEAIIDVAARSQLGIVAITDHNSCSNTERSIQYASDKYLERLLVLAGIEVTTANGHLLAYFPPAESASVQALLNRIDLVGKPGSRDSHSRRSLADVITEVERLGGLCIAAHIDRTKTGFETLVAGYPNWKQDIILSSGLYGLEFDDSANLDMFSPEDDCPTNGAQRRSVLLRRSTATSTMARVRLAPVQNSDSHTLEQFAEYCGTHRLTRFKLDTLSFDGFRTAMIDSYARVRVESTIPPAIPRLLGMSLTGGFLDGDRYRFSDNLNCFIGGRGAGKSTAIHSLAYGLGMMDHFSEQDNCPDSTVVYCEDANGVRYRYERSRGDEVQVQCKDGKTLYDNVSPDAFRIEFYGQNQLSDVAKDPLANPGLLQAFLDKHINLADLQATESSILSELEQNSAVLRPLEAAVSQLPAKRLALQAVQKKLLIAETGKVREIAANKTRLSAEGTFVQTLDAVKEFYAKGITVTQALKDYQKLRTTMGQLTEDALVNSELAQIRGAIERANASLLDNREKINSDLREQSLIIADALQRIRAQHTVLEQNLDAAIETLRKQGLSASIQQLNELLGQQRHLTLEISALEGQLKQAEELRASRTELLAQLKSTRENITTRRKGQLNTINQNLKRVIQDFSVYLRYDSVGMVDEFCELILSAMHGSYFQEAVATSLCEKVTPSALALLVAADDVKGIANLCGVDEDWATILVERLKQIPNLHAVQVADKPPKPVIKVLTKSTPQKEIAVKYLSDGQKHTILLTIAMLAESRAPLIIDQPEDDLDNAFIFRSVVDTLRRIKERRQVIVVTHNANIAVLGDSELILPMRRSANCGQAYDRGSIDRAETRKAVQEILEGGELAFRRRKEIYGTD